MWLYVKTTFLQLLTVDKKKCLGWEILYLAGDGYLSSKIKGWKSSRFWCWPVAWAARCPSPPAPPPCSSPAVAGCSDAALGCSRRLWTGCLLYSRNNREHTNMSQCHHRSVSVSTFSAQHSPLRFCCLRCSQGWSLKEWQSSCWSCLFFFSPLQK